MAREYGTNEILQKVDLLSEEGAQHFHKNFARMSIARGSVEIVNTAVERISDNLWKYEVHFKHTACCRGNHRNDSLEFVEHAVHHGGKTYAHVSHEPILLSWTPLPRPEKPLRRAKSAV